MEKQENTNSIVVHLNQKNIAFASLVSFVLFTALAAITVFSFRLVKSGSDHANAEMHNRLDSMQTLLVIGNQFLLSSVDYATERQRLILFSRDMILASKDNEATKDDAFKIASANIRECELYPNIDPLLILAQEWKETGGRFNKNAANKKSGAVGLLQVMPATALDLWDGFFKAKYDEVLLKDIDINVKIGAKYIANRYSVYKSYEVALAYYNGGQIAAEMYAAKDPGLYKETASYVPKVVGKWNEYREQFMTYKMPTSSLVTKKTVRAVQASASSQAAQEN